MKQQLYFFSMILNALLLFSQPTVAQGKAVFIKENELWMVNEDGSSLQQLTANEDEREKKSPVWAPDGSQVAFFIDQVQDDIVANIRFVNLQGKTNKILTVPTKFSESAQFMRYVKRIDWLTNKKIGYVGSIDPAYDEYRIVDLISGIISTKYDGHEFTWSPSKSRLAYIGWVPQFAPAEAKSDNLRIDDSIIYPTEEQRKQDFKQKIVHKFETNLFWSDDSKQLAFIDTVSPATNTYLIVVDVNNNQTVKIQVPEKTRQSKLFEWSNSGTVLNLIGEDLVWIVDLKSKLIEQVQKSALKSPLPKYDEMKKRKNVIDKYSGISADWLSIK